MKNKLKKIISKSLPIILTGTDVVDYVSKYRKRKKGIWGKENNLWTEHNPIFNNFISEPVNTFSALTILILYNNFKNTKLDLLQKISVLLWTNGTLMYHGSDLKYMGKLDELGLCTYLINLIYKDLLIYNPKLIKYRNMLISIFILLRYIFLIDNNIIEGGFLRNLFEVLVSLKLSSEIKKLSKNEVQMNIIFTLWVSLFSYISIKLNKYKYSNYNSIFQIIFYIFIYNRNIKNKKKLNTRLFILGLLFIIIAFLFQEEAFFKFNVGNPKSLLQFHAIWHILASIGFYIIEKYNKEYFDFEPSISTNRKCILSQKAKKAYIKSTYLLQIIPHEILENTKSKLLDVGSGDGYITRQLLQKGFNVTKIDVKNLDKYVVNVTIYDGKKLPYQNNSFDLVMVNFVLHHTNNLLDILHEVIRVTNKYIIISEDIIDTYLDKILGFIHVIKHDGIHYKNNFHSSTEWNEIFNNLNLQVIKIIDIPRKTLKIYPIKRKIYLLKIINN